MNRAAPIEIHINSELSPNDEIIATTKEKVPVRKRPAPTMRIVPIAANTDTATDPTKIPADRTSSRAE